MQDAPYRQVPLYRRDGTVRDVAVVDADQYTALDQHRWHLNNNGYAVRGDKRDGKWTAVLMHRQILGLVPGDGLEVDHVNHDKLDNRRVNLRVGTHADNTRNCRSYRGSTSRYRAVHWDRRQRKWRAKPRLHGRYYQLGYFDDEDEAGAVVQAWFAERGILV